MARYCRLSLPDEAYHKFLENHILGQTDIESENGVTHIGFVCDEAGEAAKTVYAQSDIGENIIDYLHYDCHVPFDFTAEPAEAGYEEDHGYREFYRPDAPADFRHGTFYDEAPNISAKVIRKMLERYDAQEFKEHMQEEAASQLPPSTIQMAAFKYNAEFRFEGRDDSETGNHLLPRGVFDQIMKDIHEWGESYGEFNGFEHDGVFYVLDADGEGEPTLRLDAYACGKDIALNMTNPETSPKEGGFERNVLDLPVSSFHDLKYEFVAAVVDGAVHSFEQTHASDIRKDKERAKKFVKNQKQASLGR